MRSSNSKIGVKRRTATGGILKLDTEVPNMTRKVTDHMVAARMALSQTSGSMVAVMM
jgi:hypothetical protein